MGGTGVEHRGWAMNDGTSLDWVPHPTADGSVTFLSSEFGEHFHSLQGAWDEALIKFVGPTGLGTWTGQSIRLLDICYGLGYNSAAALAVLWSVAPQCSVQWLGLERDPSVAIAAIPSVLATLDRVQGTTLPARAIHPDQGEPIVLTPEAIALTRTVITQLAETGECRLVGFEGKMRWGDARETFGQRATGDRPLNTPPVDAMFDAIFLDPFSPPQCPQLWTLDFLTIVAQRLAPTGYLATYSCAAAVRSALLTAGLAIGASPPFGRRWPGTVAAYPRNAPDPMLPPLSPQELEHLQTRAAVPYRDRLGTGSRDDILARRRREQETSSLEPTSRWKRRWFGDCRASHRSQPAPQDHSPSPSDQ